MHDEILVAHYFPPIPELLPPTLRFFPPRSPPPPSFSSYNSQKQEGFWRFTLDLGLLPARPGHVPIFSGRAVPTPGCSARSQTKAPAKGSWRFVPLGLPNTAPRPRSLSMCLLMHCHAVFLDAARNSNQVEWGGNAFSLSLETAQGEVLCWLLASLSRSSPSLPGLF